MGNFFTDNERLKFHLHNDMMKEIIRLKQAENSLLFHENLLL